jgi:peptidoglycan-associated lipoprotein
MARAWRIPWIVFSLGLVVVALAGCPRKPELAPSTGMPGAPSGGPSGGAPSSPGAPPAGAPGVAQPAPGEGPVATAPAPGAQPGGPVATAPAPGAQPGGPGVAPAPTAPGGAPGGTAPGPTAGGPGPAVPGAPGTVVPATPLPREFVEAPALQNIYFDFDRYEIRRGDGEILAENARWLKANATALVLIEGHCDERGTNEYNLALGARRATATRDYLVALGVEASRISIISYGEERPVCVERTEACWDQNRRAHFLVNTGTR